MRHLNRILLPALVLAGASTVVLYHFNASQDLAAARIAKINEQPELLRLKQLEAELIALKAHAASATSTERDRMEAQLTVLKQQMGELGKPRQNPSEAGAASAARAEPASMAEKVAADEEETRQQAQFLEGALATEAADPQWSLAAAQQISHSITGAALEHTRVGQVRCASTLCRVEVTHDSFQAEQAFILQLGQLESFRQSEGFGQRVQRSDGSVATTLFVSRAGHRLPNQSADADPQS